MLRPTGSEPTFRSVILVKVAYHGSHHTHTTLLHVRTSSQATDMDSSKGKFDTMHEDEPKMSARSQETTRAMAHRVYWDSTMGVVVIEAEGLIAPGELTVVYERVMACLPAQGPRLILTDLRRAHLSLRKDVRRELAAVSSLVPMDRDAVVGGSHLHRMFGRLVLGAAGLGDKLRLFESREQALVWLRHGETSEPANPGER